VDITRHAPTVADLFERRDLLAIVGSAEGEDLGPVRELADAAVRGEAAANGIRLLAPCDLQAIKAAGVTFAVSLLERVIEEQAKGDPSRAAA
ncbi:fumarylacetoacetate hydrolase, partial [Acinetobacter baumannii]|nr:fumarylacetoacetate hydrolase [Acinetobacter baumannii]